MKEQSDDLLLDSSTASQVQLTFAETALKQDIRTLLQEIKARITDGPSREERHAVEMYKPNPTTFARALHILCAQLALVQISESLDS